MKTEQKYMLLKEHIAKYTASGNVIVAFSGGVDSALLLKLVCMEAKKPDGVYAVTVRTKLHPAGDLAVAKQAAEEMGAALRVLEMDELAETGIQNNPVDRCYLCKKGIFLKIKELAKELKADSILEGTNGDDLHQYRPGIRALQELDIISPLAECGLTKAEIRKLAEKLGISVSDRPSAPCLATRLPYGTAISYELLQKIDEGETCLRELGFYNVRLRAYDVTERTGSAEKKQINPEKQAIQKQQVIQKQQAVQTGGGEKEAVKYAADLIEGKKWLARIEVDAQALSKLLSCREEVIKKIKRLGFAYVTVDMEGFRSGSMDSFYSL